MKKIALSLGVVALAGVAQGATISTYLTTSNTIDSPLNIDPAYNSNSYYNYIGGAEGGTKPTKVLYRFDLPVLPDDAVVNSATLRIQSFGEGSDNTAPITANVYAVLKPFTNGVTWTNYDGTNPWETAGLGSGTDYEAAAITSVTFGAGYNDVDITSQYVQWQNGDEANNGLVFIAQNPASDGYLRLGASEPVSGPDPSTALELVIDYTVVPEPASLGLIGLGGLMMLRRRR